MGKFENDMDSVWKKENFELEEEKDKKLPKSRIYAGKLKVQIPHIRKIKSEFD